jgi:DNA-directed RNA polymerase specialized sigma subunit
MTDRGRQRKGEAHRNAKLKDRDVQVMRVLRSIGCDLSEIGERYGVTPQTVWRVEKRISYRYVPDLDLSQEVLR